MAADKNQTKRGVYVLDRVNFIQQKYVMWSKCYKNYYSAEEVSKMGYSSKKDIFLWTTPPPPTPVGNFRFVNLPCYRNSGENKLSPLKILQNCVTVTPLVGILRTKTKTHGNSVASYIKFFEHPWKFHYFCNWTLLPGIWQKENT